MKKDVSKIEWNPMKIIMKINLKWRIQLYKNEEAKNIFKKIIEEFIKFSKEEKFQPIFLMFPQKDDVLFIKSNYNFYEKFMNELQNINELKIINLTEELLQENDLDKLYSDDNEYGGHFSKLGNKRIAEIINKKIKGFI